MVSESSTRRARSVWRYNAWSMYAIIVMIVIITVAAIVAVRDVSPALQAMLWALGGLTILGAAGGIVEVSRMRARPGRLGFTWSTWVLIATTIGLIGLGLWGLTGWLLALPWLGIAVSLVLVGQSVPFAPVIGPATVLACWFAFGGASVTMEVIGASWTVLAISLFCALVMPPTRWLWNSYLELERARKASAENAVLAEQIRFSHELHDVQGHSLQVIALKAELARRTLDRDRDAALGYLREVEQLAQSALTESRTLAFAYRKTSLPSELGNAVEVLQATGIQVSTRAPADVIARLSPADAQLFGVVIREATTNILRHAQASRVSIELSNDRQGFALTVRNDGVAHDAPTVSPMSGLATLLDRANGRGGTLTTTRDGSDFVLSVSVSGLA